MGISIDIHCDACGWEEGFRLGTGSAMTRLRNALDLVPEEQRIRILDILDHHPDSAEDFELRLMRCPACGRLFERMQVSLLFGENDRWQSRHHCDGCGAALAPVPDPEEIQTLPCPDCGSTTLQVIDTSFWD